MSVRKRASDRSTRSKVRSPGRPPAWQREHRCQFWHSIGLGRSSEEAGLDAGVSAPLGPRWFRQAGGMPPTHFAPRAKMPSGRYLCFREREEIALELAKGVGIRAIARKLGRSPSTVSREVRRNAATRSGGLDYRASAAQWHADRAALRPRPGELAGNPALHAYVIERLAGKISDAEGATFDGPSVVWKKRRAVHRQSRRWSTAWSPEQIAHRLRLDYPEDRSMRISHEAIYQSLYIQGRGELRRELSACLRSGRALRVPRERSRVRNKSFIGDAIMISDRPADIADRAVPGHWEGDLILGLASSAIGTLMTASMIDHRIAARCACDRFDRSQTGEGRDGERGPCSPPKNSSGAEYFDAKAFRRQRLGRDRTTAARQLRHHNTRALAKRTQNFSICFSPLDVRPFL